MSARRYPPSRLKQVPTTTSAHSVTPTGTSAPESLVERLGEVAAYLRNRAGYWSGRDNAKQSAACYDRLTTVNEAAAALTAAQAELRQREQRRTLAREWEAAAQLWRKRAEAAEAKAERLEGEVARALSVADLPDAVAAAFTAALAKEPDHA